MCYTYCVVYGGNHMPMTSKEMIKLLKKNGFIEKASNGSHRKLYNHESRRTVIVPYHNKSLKKGIEKAILQQAGIK